VKVWQEHLQPNDSTKATAVAVRRLLQLCHSDSATESELQELADCFAAKYMPVLEEESSLLAVCGLVSQLLWYHFPRIASTVATQTGSPTLQALVRRACGDSGVALTQRLLAAGSQSEAASLLAVCDAGILEGRETLLIFILLALLAQAPLREAAEADEVVTCWSEAIGSLGQLGAEEVHAILDLAHDLYEVTPLCLASAWPSRDFTEQDVRICGITADEVLRHIYEQPTSSWRFVVVDVRSTVDIHVALPVSIRIESTEDRAAVLAEMPYEECIHLCLVGDVPPTTSSDDEAVRLCMGLCREPSWRKHVSVVEGGWPGVAALVQSMGLELMDVELELAAEALEVAGGNGHSENSFRTAAVAVGQKVARRSRKLTSGFLKGATKALQRLSDDISEMTENLTGGHPSEMGKRPRRREIEFEQGTLGFDLQGNVVKLVDADGQAATSGVSVGDRLVAVEGREVPMPPDTDTQEVRDLRVKRLIKKWIKEQRRPVKLTFEPPSGLE